MLCSFSGDPCEVPVVTPSGKIYEKRLLESELSTNGGKDPSTGEPLSMDQVIVVRTEQVTRPRPLTATSIPSMLMMFQSEWDTLMLETFQLKKQLESTRQELAQALYQQDASCRVIARLLKERDEARVALANVRPDQPMAEAGPTEMTREIQMALVKLSKKLSAGRKKRQISQSLAKAEDICQYGELSSHPIHKASEPGITCVAVHPNNPDRIVSGGVDKVVVLFNRTSQKKVATLTGHSKRINEVMFHPTEELVFSASADKTVRIWSGTPSGYDCTQRIRTHTHEVTSMHLHPSGDYLATASLDETWALADVKSGNNLLHVQAVDNPSVHCIRFHPDGLLVATGGKDSIIRLWDVKDKGKNVAKFTGHEGLVSSLAFSENGYYMASASADNTVKMWDLRKLKDFATATLTDSDNTPQRVTFDHSGVYLAVAGQDVRVFVAKTLKDVAVYNAHKALVSDVAFGPDARWLVSTSMDRSLKIFGSQ
mmetsp:Transcript_20728/g.58334  ORF Transcript_20728/g.58334 Transcript_20728/m.58334 type:complete len:484 (+) Transcript_20728:188-1639(+)|eukprot:CAMPEP_0119132434 /NCGR_PEP_ID=MMETSP1310-20130426/11832_1 /TAXON_ID=464262 /ORGANISM="Genus nov. species nov., Strain RCC2339" /LENGTH=483 /DNA_ID=CAMNT_0007123067 /DNA_START=166 /DNA_END=1617 /DNA_ORIENTATION=+